MKNQTNFVLLILKMHTHDNNVFPENYFDIGGLTFETVYKQKPDYVKFTIDKMKQTTGFYTIWKTYCEDKYKDTNE